MPRPDRPKGLAFAATNNLACRADVLAMVPFNEDYPNAAAEDREWCARLLSSGFELVAEPTAIVFHRHQLNFVRFLRQHLRYGRGAYRYRRARGSALRLEKPRFYTGLVRQGFERGLATGALVCVAQLATAAGFAAEGLATRRRLAHGKDTGPKPD
jgi:GT2 family glycosyltransferase